MIIRAAISIFLYGLLPLPLYADLEPETIPKSLTLPESYPDTWVFAHDAHILSMVAGRVMLIDVAATSRQYKGDFQASVRGAFAESKRRNELYVAETVYARGMHGTRTDLITIYNKTHLKPIAEIILPGNKRALMGVQKGLFRLTGDEQFALVYNFTPGASVTVVDLDQRKVVNEVSIPGCTFIYPMGKRGFSTLCGNGSMASYQLNHKGQVTTEVVSEIFNDIDNDPLFMASTVVNGVRYFPSFHGQIQPIDMRSGLPKVKKTWGLVSESEAAESWRPSGGQVISADKAGRLYVAMRREAPDGQQDKDKYEVWVFDVNKQQHIARIALKNGGYSIEVTKGQTSYLVVVNNKSELDVYDANNGKFIRTIGGWPTVAPSVLHATK